MRYLVENHEIGGDEDASILRDADSISFFDYNIYFYYKDLGEEKTKNKIKHMFERCSEKAKNIIRKFNYKDEKLNKLFQKNIS